MKTARSEMTISSGNVFEDLGLSNAADLDAKARLGEILVTAIRERQSSQRELAELLRIPQPTVSAIMNYKFEGLSVERLMNLLARLGRSVTIEISETSTQIRGRLDFENGIEVKGQADSSLADRSGGQILCRVARRKRSPVRFTANVYASALNLSINDLSVALPRLA